MSVKYLSKEQTNKVIENIKFLHHKVIVLLMLDAGLRVSEAISLKYNDFDFKNRLIIVKTLKKRGKNITRSIPISNRLYQTLANYLGEKSNINGEDYLFPSKILPGHHITRHAINKFLTRLNNNKLGFPFLFPHSLRHSFGTHHISKGTPLENIKTMLGHAKYDTTLIYAKIPTEILKENIEKVTDNKRRNVLNNVLKSLGIRQV